MENLSEVDLRGEWETCEEEVLNESIIVRKATDVTTTDVEWGAYFRNVTLHFNHFNEVVYEIYIGLLCLSPR